ncbi:molybdenum cofactor cytidylyltransferase [Frankia sp. EI5c]|uniref:nucleotidyltransferase family protein n=1 Tax=Frankia sp. EI5c TaxID=683316 RepID=UPI0007C2B682|nr:nucleotidyltransferase family protein [Frankia sp. EI5c]OAA26358.1 molybdenum cofactor cytidylyltransferase [Frankia sp. EI5c]
MIRPAGARIAAVVLAAGSGSRMGTPKAALTVNGTRLVDRAVKVAHEARCQRIIAVVRAGTRVPGAELVVNTAPEQGLRSSLTLALNHLASPGDIPVDAVAVLLVDTPGIGSEAVRAVLDAWRPGRVALARYGQRRGHPIVMSPDRWRAAIALARPDEGARRFLAAHPDLIDEVAAPGDPTDLDTPADLRRWTSSTGERAAARTEQPE